MIQSKPGVCARGPRTRFGLAKLLVLATGADAHAARLDVRGPVGAEVLVDGEAVGTLPFDQWIRLETGEYDLEVRAPGYVVHQEVVKVTSPEDEIVLDLDLLPLSRWQAVGSSTVLAGLGQLYQRRPVTGWTMRALQITAWGALAATEAQYQSARDDYQEAVVAYEQAITAGQIRIAREDMEVAFDDVESKNDLRTYATVAVVAIGAWSVFDAWRAHSGFFAGPDVDAPAFSSVGPAGGMPAIRAGWKWTF